MRQWIDARSTVVMGGLAVFPRALWLGLLIVGGLGFAQQAAAADAPKPNPPKTAPSTSAKPTDPKDAEAKPTHDLVVWVLHADNSKKGIDKRLEKVRHLLRKPPLSAYKSYEVAEKIRLPLLLERKSLKIQGRFAFALQRIDGREKDRVHYRYWLGRETDRSNSQVTLGARVGHPTMVFGPTWDEKQKDSGRVALLLRVRPHQSLPLPAKPAPKK